MSDDLNIVLHIKELRHETNECMSIVFERPQGLTFDAGDWMDLRFPVPEFPVGKTYSFASSPTEPDLMITFRKGVSPFKKALENVQPGETMLITQYGSNGFLLDRRYPSVFLAGGIGIAPFRGMIKELVDSHTALDILLLFSNHRDDFPFRTELEAWQHAHLSFIQTGLCSYQRRGQINEQEDSNVPGTQRHRTSHHSPVLYRRFTTDGSQL